MSVLLIPKKNTRNRIFNAKTTRYTQRFDVQQVGCQKQGFKLFAKLLFPQRRQLRKEENAICVLKTTNGLDDTSVGDGNKFNCLIDFAGKS